MELRVASVKSQSLKEKKKNKTTTEQGRGTVHTVCLSGRFDGVFICSLELTAHTK